MADKNYKLTFALSDGTSKSVQFTAPQGATGATGQRGTGILKITTAPSSYTTATGGFTPTYRVSLSTVKTQSNVSSVLVGDVLQYNYYQYPVGYVDGSYVYTGARTSIRGATGTAGTNGTNGADGYTPVKGVDYWTAADKAEIISEVKSIPDYVKTEADAVISRVMEAQTSGRVFTMAVLADMHYGSGNYTDGVDHAAQAIKYIADRIKLDVLNVQGDYTDKYIDSDYANGISDIYAVHALLSDVDAEMLTMGGNHDYHTTGSPQVARALQGKSDNVVWGSRTGGYYYRDFDDYKLRVIVLNTSETAGGHANIACSTEQYAWFVSSLDLSDKSDVEEWQTLIMSHHPLDWSISDDGVYRFANILKAYKKGTSWSGGGVSCDFTEKNAAKIICNVHGHLHNLLVDKICLGVLGMASDTTNVYRMCMPEACLDRPQSYGGLWNTAETYAKTANTADDTSFTVLCIDLENFTIRAINYGAGVDRTLVYYDPAEDSAENMIKKAVDSSGNPFNGGQGWISGQRLNSSGAQVANADYCVTGFIPVAKWDYLYLENMNLVIGDLNSQPNTRAVLYSSDFTMRQITTTDTILEKAHWGGTDGYILNESGGAAAMGDTIGRLRIVNDGAAYIRFSTKKIDDTSVVTINEEIV